MKKISDQELKNIWREAKRAAGVCLNVDAGLPDKTEVHSLACALLTAGLVSTGKPIRAHGAQDADAEDMLSGAYGDGDRN